MSVRNNEYFCKIFEASPIPTVILEGNFPMIFIKEANEAYAALTGQIRKKLIGTPFFITSSHSAMYLDKQGFKDVEHSVEMVYLHKTAIKTPIQKFLVPIPENDDFETLYLEATNTPVLNTVGDIDFIVRTLQNVTEVMRAAEKERERDRQLIENEKFLSETQKVAKIGSWEMDSNNRFNWSDIHYDIMEVKPGTEITVDFGVKLLKSQQDRDIFAAVYKNAVEKGDHFDVDLNIITPKGNERWIRFTGAGELKEGQFVKMYGIGQDITEHKLLQQQLIDSHNQIEIILQTIDGVVFECDPKTLAFNFVSKNRLIQSDDVVDILKQASDQIYTQNNYTGDYRLIRENGAVKWMRISVSVIRENGTLKLLRGMMMDITASKRILELERIEKKVLEINANPSATTVEVLKTYLEGIEFIFPEMQCAIMQERHGYLYNWAANSLPPEYLAAIDHLPVGDNTGSCGTAAFLNETVMVSDIASDHRWVAYKNSALKNNLHSCWSQPLRNAAGEVIATLGMYYKTVKSPTEEELKVIDRTAHLLQVILQARNNLELLEEANLLMEQSQELAHFGSVQYEVGTRKLTWSKELYTIFGIDKHIKPTTDFYYDSLHPDDVDRVKLIIQNALKTKEDYVAEERIIRPDGEIRTLRTWGRIRSNEAGEVVKVVSAYLDITESKKIQEELLASESRLRSLVDSQTNYVIRIDFNENYTYVNKKYREDFGFVTGESLLGINSMHSTMPHQRKKIEAVCEKCIEHPNEVFECELKKYGNDGSIKYTFWHFVCLTNSKGEPREIQCIGIDISDLKAAEYAREKKTIELEKSEQKYSDLFHLSPQPMWVYDPDSLLFLDVNNAALEQYGYLREEFLTMTMSDIQPVKHSLKTELKQQDFYEGIFTQVLKSGELITVDIKQTKIPFRDKIANLTLAINITEPIRYLEALEKQNELLSEIAWIQSHAVRAPLSRIIGLVDLLQNNIIESTEKSFVLDEIVSSAAELDTIIVDIIRKAERITIIPDK